MEEDVFRTQRHFACDAAPSERTDVSQLKRSLKNIAERGCQTPKRPVKGPYGKIVLAARFEAPRPSVDHVAEIVERGLSRLDEDLAKDAAARVADRWSRSPRITLRQVDDLIKRIRAAARAPKLHS